jgi:hypothetical protein
MTYEDAGNQDNSKALGCQHENRLFQAGAYPADTGHGGEFAVFQDERRM